MKPVAPLFLKAISCSYFVTHGFNSKCFASNLDAKVPTLFNVAIQLRLKELPKASHNLWY